MQKIIDSVAADPDRLPVLVRAIREAVEREDHDSLYEVAAAAIGHRIIDPAKPSE
jgi:hypothetical protein